MSTAQTWRVRIRRAIDGLVVLAAIASVPLTIAQLQDTQDAGVIVVDWVVWAIFLTDAALALARASGWRERLRAGWLPVVLVVLTFPAAPAALHGAGLVRLTRLTRLVRLAFVASRAVRAIQRTLGRRGFLLVAALNAVVIAVGAGAIAAVEPEVVKGSYWNGLWWAVVTATTVGYGDISPSSVPGRLVASIIMFTGIGLLSTLAATITAFFVGQEDQSEFAELRARLERIEALLQDRRPG